MTIKYLAGTLISGLSSDTKPTTVPTNSIFIETNTGSFYIFNGSSWGTLGGSTNLNALSDVDTTTAAPTNNQVLTYNSSSSQWVPATPPGAGGGEANTMTNIGTAGVGVYKQKTGVQFELKKINTVNSSNITVTDDTGNNEVDLDIGANVLTTTNTKTVTGKTINMTDNVMPNMGSYAYSIYQDGGAVKLLENSTGTVTPYSTLGPAVDAVLANTNNPTAVIHSGQYNLASGFAGWALVSKTHIKCDGLVIINVPPGFSDSVWKIVNSSGSIFGCTIDGGLLDEQGTQTNNWVGINIGPTGTGVTHGHRFRNIEVVRANAAVWVHTTGVTWANDIWFTNIQATACKYLGYYDHAGTYTPNTSGPSNNHWLSCSFQTTASTPASNYPQALGGIIGVVGQWNQFTDVFIWDLTGNNSSAPPMSIGSNANATTITGGGLTYGANFVDNGTNTVIIDEWHGLYNTGTTNLYGPVNQINTFNINKTAQAGLGEDLLAFTVSDAIGDSFTLSNSTSVDGIFGPYFICTQNSTSVGTGSVGLYFETRVKASTDVAGANWCNFVSGRRLDGAQMVDRGLFAIGNKFDTVFGFYPTKLDMTTKKLTNFTLPSALKSSNYTLTDNDYAIRADANSAGFTIALPTAVDTDIYTLRTGKEFFIKKIDTTTNIVIIDGSGTQTIEGLLTWELRQPNDWVKIRSDGANWNVVGSSKSPSFNSIKRTGTTAPDTYYLAGQVNGTALATATQVTANQLYSLPFEIDRVQTIDKVGVNVTTGVASSNVRLGIYKDLNGVPSALIADLGTVATTTPAALKEITGLSQKLQPGIYWLTAVFSHTPTISYLAAGGITSMMGVTSAAAINTAITATFTYAALPSTHTTPVKSTATSQPALFYHFSG